MFGIIKKKFVVLWASIFNGSNSTRCASLNNQKSMIQPTLNNLLLFVCSKIR